MLNIKLQKKSPVPFGTGDRCLSSFAKEEQGQHAGTHMGTGDRFVGAEDQLFRLGNGKNFISQCLGLLLAVAVGNGNDLVLYPPLFCGHGISDRLRYDPLRHL